MYRKPKTIQIQRKLRAIVEQKVEDNDYYSRQIVYRHSEKTIENGIPVRTSSSYIREVPKTEIYRKVSSDRRRNEGRYWESRWVKYGTETFCRFWCKPCARHYRELDRHRDEMICDEEDFWDMHNEYEEDFCNQGE